jgi:hypothetical protein
MASKLHTTRKGHNKNLERRERKEAAYQQSLDTHATHSPRKRVRQHDITPREEPIHEKATPQTRRPAEQPGEPRSVRARRNEQAQREQSIVQRAKKVGREIGRTTAKYGRDLPTAGQTGAGGKATSRDARAMQSRREIAKEEEKDYRAMKKRVHQRGK